MSDEDNLELYKKYRPKSFKTLVGQESAVEMLEGMLQRNAVPHTLLFSGPSGCGKTTLARIMQKKLDCGPRDFAEYNGASSRGIDDVRNWEVQMKYAPMGGPCRIFYIDECHKLTNEAQNAFLKALEDTPSWVYFFLATTEPNKLLKTIQTRCSEVKLKLLKHAELLELVRNVLDREGVKLSDEVCERVAEYAEGSARKALVLLHQCYKETGEDAQLKALQASLSRRGAVDLAKALINKRTSWKDVANILKEMEDEPEGVRRLVLGWANTCLLGGGEVAARAALIIRYFQYDLFNVGKPGLTLACWEVMNHE